MDSSSGGQPDIRHPFRSSLPFLDGLTFDETEPRPRRSDIAFFFITFASAFVIFYGLFC